MTRVQHNEEIDMPNADWLPSLISTGALGLVWYDTRRCRTEMKKETEKVGDRVKLLEAAQPGKYFEEVESSYLTKEQHEILCGSKAKDFKITLMESIQALKDEIFPELRKIHEAIIAKPTHK
jgi:hypothetical protein